MYGVAAHNYPGLAVGRLSTCTVKHARHHAGMVPRVMQCKPALPARPRTHSTGRHYLEHTHKPPTPPPLPPWGHIERMHKPQNTLCAPNPQIHRGPPTARLRDSYLSNSPLMVLSVGRCGLESSQEDSHIVKSALQSWSVDGVLQMVGLVHIGKR